MKIKNIILLLILQFQVSQVFSMIDTSFYRANPKLIRFTAEEVKYGGATIFEDNRFINYNRNDRVITRHRIVFIRTSEGLNAHNKVVISLPKTGSILNIRARSISSSGKIIELNKDNIKEMKDFYKGGNLKIFAIEGAEVGGQIEYSYTIKTPLYDAGRESFSREYKTKKANVIIICDEFFMVKSKSFNSDDYLGENYSSDTKYEYEFVNIAPISEEKYATPKANTVMVEYKLVGSEYFKTTYSNYKKLLLRKKKDYFTFTKQELKRAKKILKPFESELKNEEETLRELTVFLKKNFRCVQDYSNNSYQDIKKISKTGLANDIGMIKLYCLILNKLNVEYEVLITGNKYENRLDKKYCSRYTMDEFAIYFPKYKTYLYPASQYMHYGIVPSWIVGNTAFVVSENGWSPRFMEISSNHPDSNNTSLTINVDLDLINNTSVFNIKAFGTGLLAASYNRSIYFSETEEEKKKVLENIVSWRYSDAEIQKINMIHPEKWGDISYCKDYSCKRKFEAKIKSTTFFVNIGDKLLLKVGALLGPQVEMYSKLERVQPITTAYNKSYNFDIRIKIPEGYEYDNAKNTIIKNDIKDELGRVFAGFSSEVKVEDGMILIKIYEFYKKINVDKKYYQDYRTVINSAADFNKAIILLKKK